MARNRGLPEGRELSAATKPELGECPLTASHTRRACDNGGSCWCIEHPAEVAAINAHSEVSEARTALRGSQ